MSHFPLHSVDSAPADSQAVLTAATAKYGFTPNLLALLANAPAALKAYISLSTTLATSSLSEAEQQVVLLTVSVENRCSYCVAAHSVIAGSSLDAASIEALRQGGGLADPRLNALARYTRAVVRERGWVSAEQLSAFEAAGFERSQALDVLVGVATKTLSNYANHLAEPPLDAAFEKARWLPAGSAAA